MTPTYAGGTAASEWTIGAPLTKGKQTAVPIGAGATINMADVEVTGENELSVTVSMTGGASADLTIQVLPFMSDNTTPMSIPLTPTMTVGPTFAAGIVQTTQTFDVSAFSKVRITVKNNNAGAQTINDFSWKCSPG